MSLLLIGLLMVGCEFGSTGNTTDGDVPTDGDTAVDGDAADGDEPDGDVEPIETVMLNAPAAWITTPATKTPLNIRQSWTGDPATSITIAWRTELTDTAAYTPKVWFAKASDVEGEGEAMQLPYAAALVAEGTGLNYTAGYDSNADYPFVLWTVEVTGLAPHTDYYFRAGTFGAVDLEAKTMADPELSPIFSFRTGLKKGAAEPFRFMSCGDSRGAYEDIAANAERLNALDFDFWLFNGDMTNGGSASEWMSWFNAMDPINNNNVVMVQQGNHEFVAELYYNQFNLPKMGAPLAEEWQEHAWSFNYGNAHFIGLNTITEMVVEAEKAWLEADLKAASEDDDIDWIFVMIHHPAYSASKKHGSTDRVVTHFVPLFEKYGVDAVFAGHDHNYERSCSVRQSNCQTDGSGVVYLVVGGFYSDGYSNGTDWWTVTSFHGDLHNYMAVDVNDKSASFVAYDGDGNQLDTFTLTK
jgi:hypothetical protein